MTTAWISDAELTKVRRRHEAIDQDALVEVDAAPSDKAQPPKPPSIRSVRWDYCPSHVGQKKTGLVPGDGEKLVFRPHSKWVGKFRIECPGSGSLWIDKEAAK